MELHTHVILFTAAVVWKAGVFVTLHRHKFWEGVEQMAKKKGTVRIVLTPWSILSFWTVASHPPTTLFA